MFGAGMAIQTAQLDFRGLFLNVGVAQCCRCKLFQGRVLNPREGQSPRHTGWELKTEMSVNISL